MKFHYSFVLDFTRFLFFILYFTFPHFTHCGAAFNDNITHESDMEDAYALWVFFFRASSQTWFHFSHIVVSQLLLLSFFFLKKTIFRSTRISEFSKLL